MRVWLCFALAGCSFSGKSIGASTDGTPAPGDGAIAGADAATDGAVVIDASRPIDAAVVIDASLPVDAAHCPADFVTLAGAPASSRYKIYSYSAVTAQSQAESYTTSKATCSGQGAYIAIVDNAAEAAAIAAVIKLDPANPYYRVGVDDLASPGAWVTVLGAPATYLPWASGQPNGANGVTTGGFCTFFDASGAMYDQLCSTPFAFACECE